MKRRFTKIFITAIMIMAGMTACGQKKNVTTDDVSEKEMANIQETAAQEVTAQEIITQEITTEKEPENDEYVLVKKYIPDIYVELRYATENNFTGVKIYDFTEAYLRYGTVISMPTEFDDFSLKADRDYSDIEDEEAVKNVMILQNAMENNGFTGYQGEWWDYSDTDEYEAVDFEP